MSWRESIVHLLTRLKAPRSVGNAQPSISRTIGVLSILEKRRGGGDTYIEEDIFVEVRIIERIMIEKERKKRGGCGGRGGQSCRI